MSKTTTRTAAPRCCPQCGAFARVKRQSVDSWKPATGWERQTVYTCDRMRTTRGTYGCGQTWTESVPFDAPPPVLDGAPDLLRSDWKNRRGAA